MLFDFRQEKGGSAAAQPIGAAARLVSCMMSVLIVTALVPESLPAKTPEVSIIPEQALHFGTFMVFGSGSRTVSASGTVIDNAIVALEGSIPAPARFTVRYDRGNENNHVLDIEIELVMSSPERVRTGGVEGAVSGFQTDLPGATQVSAMRPFRIVLRNCRSRVCTRSFQVGGRIDVTRQFGGADLTIPLPMDARVISVERQR